MNFETVMVLCNWLEFIWSILKVPELAGFWLLTILQLVIIFFQLFYEAFIIQPLERGVHIVLAIFILTQVCHKILLLHINTSDCYWVTLCNLFLPGFFRPSLVSWLSGKWSDTHKVSFASDSWSSEASAASKCPPAQPVTWQNLLNRNNIVPGFYD